MNPEPSKMLSNIRQNKNKNITNYQKLIAKNSHKSPKSPNFGFKILNQTLILSKA